MRSIAEVEKEIMNSMEREWPRFRQGDILRVSYKITEKDKERIHPVEGIVIKTQGHMHRRTFTIRRIAYGQAYEVTFPYYSPLISKIEVMATGKRKPRRNKLYYLRKRVGRKAMSV